jgi:serine phosphatase RsbU (regulator of sigma subunit)
MASLVITKGPDIGHRFTLEADCSSIGREPEAVVYLESLAVSRKHARILFIDGGCFVEDVGSSNHTYVNGAPITQRVRLTERDELQIGPYVMVLRPDRPSGDAFDPIVRAQVSAAASNYSLYTQNPAHKLQVVLEITQELGQTLAMDVLLGRLLESLLRLFPQADRGMVLLCERDRFVVRAQRSRQQGSQADYPYSRTIVRRALNEGVALLSEDVGGDPSLALTETVMSLKLRSFLCVPLIGHEKKRLGVIQLDCLRQSQAFRSEDLELLTAIALHVLAVVENAALHEVELREARLSQELMMAREVQQSFLPREFDPLGPSGPDLFAQVLPARDVSGDLYDFLRLPGGRLAFMVGDVSGKGMPAALFMIAVRTLFRYLAPKTKNPADFVRQLHAALAADNPTNKYVTLIYGIYDPHDGSVAMVSGGHWPPLVRHADGRVTVVEIHNGPVVGFSLLPVVSATDLDPRESRIILERGETLVLFTDGFPEAFAPNRTDMYGLERLCEAVGRRGAMPLNQCAREIGAEVRSFTHAEELQDDQTLFLLRRR